MKIGSVDHRELFCCSFMESYREYEPEHLPWPDLDNAALTLLRSIPFWGQALNKERQAGVIVSEYAKTLDRGILQDAIALQGEEESRHARLLKVFIERYDIPMPACPPIEIPANLEQTFTVFGFEECLDSFFAFGLFEIAREARVFPEQIFTIFDSIIDEEARHIVFFVNWFTDLQIQRGHGFLPLRSAKTLWYYGRALSSVIKAIGESDPNGAGFTASGASVFSQDLTLEKFLKVCIQENQRRMSKFDSRILQPQLLPRLASTALNTLQLLPKRKAFGEGVRV
ncbi:hypothetical protein ACX27_29290 [Nostoc piscinale CENA21]|uniref:Ferritin-like domain-containing protein n=1 Tax=Nostoc piscinale CENA21 TaxID=224013 RepID=A0A0M3V6T9_9NOSO|nr:ferritin-like domain-containing protein [Nostoc piscinale]ALF56017.1 hypothetical protein ACX27_29290 [Nostoc piscinale CENA21]